MSSSKIVITIIGIYLAQTCLAESFQRSEGFECVMQQIAFELSSRPSNWRFRDHEAGDHVLFIEDDAVVQEKILVTDLVPTGGKNTTNLTERKGSLYLRHPRLVEKHYLGTRFRKGAFNYNIPIGKWALASEYRTLQRKKGIRIQLLESNTPALQIDFSQKLIRISKDLPVGLLFFVTKNLLNPAKKSWIETLPQANAAQITRFFYDVYMSKMSLLSNRDDAKADASLSKRFGELQFKLKDQPQALLELTTIYNDHQKTIELIQTKHPNILQQRQEKLFQELEKANLKRRLPYVKETFGLQDSRLDNLKQFGYELHIENSEIPSIQSIIDFISNHQNSKDILTPVRIFEEEGDLVVFKWGKPPPLGAKPNAGILSAHHLVELIADGFFLLGEPLNGLVFHTTLQHDLAHFGAFLRKPKYAKALQKTMHQILQEYSKDEINSNNAIDSMLLYTLEFFTLSKVDVNKARDLMNLDPAIKITNEISLAQIQELAKETSSLSDEQAFVYAQDLLDKVVQHIDFLGGASGDLVNQVASVYETRNSEASEISPPVKLLIKYPLDFPVANLETKIRAFLVAKKRTETFDELLAFIRLEFVRLSGSNLEKEIDRAFSWLHKRKAPTN